MKRKLNYEEDSSAKTLETAPGNGASSQENNVNNGNALLPQPQQNQQPQQTSNVVRFTGLTNRMNDLSDNELYRYFRDASRFGLSPAYSADTSEPFQRLRTMTNFDEIAEVLLAHAMDLRDRYLVQEFDSFLGKFHDISRYAPLLPPMLPSEPIVQSSTAKQESLKVEKPFIARGLEPYLGPIFFDSIEENRFAVEFDFNIESDLKYQRIYLICYQYSIINYFTESFFIPPPFDVYINGNNQAKIFLYSQYRVFDITKFCHLGSNRVRLICLSKVPENLVMEVGKVVYNCFAPHRPKFAVPFGTVPSKLPSAVNTASARPRTTTAPEDKELVSYFDNASKLMLCELGKKHRSPFNNLRYFYEKSTFVKELSGYAIALKQQRKWDEFNAYFDELNRTGYFSVLMPFVDLPNAPTPIAPRPNNAQPGRIIATNTTAQRPLTAAKNASASDDFAFFQVEPELKERSWILAQMKSSQSDDDIQLADDSLTIDLRCPISLSRIKIPVRFFSCKHPQCFDLDVFKQFAFNILQRTRTALKCPVCSAQVQKSAQLIECGLFKEILADSSTQSLSKVKIDLSNGNLIQSADESIAIEADSDEGSDGEEGLKQALQSMPSQPFDVEDYVPSTKQFTFIDLYNAPDDSDERIESHVLTEPSVIFIS